jgi:cytochrome P450
VLNVYGIHRSAKHYDRPDDFIPDRWLNDSDSDDRPFFAFGYAQRGCFGRKLAVLELTLLLYAMLRVSD